MLGIIKKGICSAIDWAISVRWLSPVASMVLVVSGAFLTVDFSEWINSNKNWSGPLRMLDKWILYIFFIGAFINLSISLLKSYREKTIKQIQGENDVLNAKISEFANSLRELSDGFLIAFSTKIKIRQEDQVRITIYIHDNDRGRFIPFGRYSPNPKLMVAGRTFYPDNEGCIAKCWENGWHFDSNIPEDETQRKVYQKNNYGLSAATVKNLTMAPRLYAASRITDGNGKSLGVLMIEALHANRFDEAELREALRDHHDTFSSMIVNVRDYIPNPSTAGESGL